ncbi:MAG: DMT family transporter [Pseudomonadota bacterium]
MNEWIVEIAGTPQGEQLALILAVISAFAHAIFAALNKGGHDPYLSRGVINVAYSMMAAPFVLFVLPWPETNLFPLLFASYLAHLGYEWFQSAAFTRGAFTLVYPIARGTGPLLTALLAIFVFAEYLEPGQWAGILLLSGAIASLAIINLRQVDLTPTIRENLLPSILFALGAGIGVASYTTLDAYGIRETANPLTFLAWFFFLGGYGFPLVAFARWRKMEDKPKIKPLIARGIIGALIAYCSFGMLMLATRIGKVSEAAALRETSIIFATLIGVIFFKESLTKMKLAVICLIALGAIMVEFG